MNHVLDIEALSKIALLGGAYDWRQTPIQITPTAHATDPVRLAKEGWWKRAEPRDSSGREILRLVERAGLDTTEEFKRERDARRKQNESYRREGVADELVPAENESIQQWFARLAKVIDFNGRKKLLWDALRSYASRFRGDVSAKKTLDAKLVQQFLKNVSGD